MCALCIPRGQLRLASGSPPSCPGAGGVHRCWWVCKGLVLGCAVGEWVLWGPGVLPCLWAPVGLCLRCLWFTFDPVLYICKQL